MLYSSKGEPGAEIGLAAQTRSRNFLLKETNVNVDEMIQIMLAWYAEVHEGKSMEYTYGFMDAVGALRDHFAQV